MNAQDHFNTSDVSDSHSDTSEDEDAINTENPIVIQLNIGDKLSPFQVYRYINNNFHKINVAGFIPGFAFIQFAKDKHAINMLDKHGARGIHMDGHRVQLKQADCSYVPYGMYEHVKKSTSTTSTAPTDADGHSDAEPSAVIEVSPVDITIALNDHCLREILSRLSWVNLVSVSQTCKGLQKIATAVFDTKFKNKKITLNDLVKDTGTTTSIEYFLKNFGASIRTISMESHLPAQECGNILRLIGQYCKNITTLGLHGHGWMTEHIVENNADWFGRLETVGLVGGFLAINSFLNTCTQLKVFGGMMIDCLDLTHVTLPHLTDIDLSFFKCRGMGGFLIRHPQMEAIKFQMPDPIVSDSLSGDTDQFIFRHLPNIRDMEIFEPSNETMSRLCGMEHLKSLYLDGVNRKPLAPMLKNFSSQQRTVETLELANWIVDSTAIGHLSKMKSITKIMFMRCLFINDQWEWTRLIDNLPQLKLIVTSTTWVGNMDEILPTLKSRRIEWANELLSHVSYDPRNELVVFRKI